MQVIHGTSVLITDGRKALLLRNEGDADFPDLRLVRKWEEATPADRDLKVDAPGRSFSSHDHGTRRSAFDETDFHRQAEAQFAAELAEFLNAEKAREELVIVAPPRTLGELRGHLDRTTAERVTAEIAKDLVKHSIADIERLLACYAQPIRTA